MVKKIIAVSAVLTFAIAACTTPMGTPTDSPDQQFLKTAVMANQTIDQLALAADASLRAGVLKGNDARNTLAALQVARDGVQVAATLDPAQGVNKVQMTLAVLAATQAYLATLPKAAPWPAPASGAKP